MAPRFGTVSKDEILAVNESAAPTNTKNWDKIWLVGVNWSVDKNFLTPFATKSLKNYSQNTVNWNLNNVTSFIYIIIIIIIFLSNWFGKY